MTTVPPPKVDTAWINAQQAVTPRDRDRLCLALMEARDCSHPDAAAYIDEHGEEHAERVVRQRWLD